MKPVITQRGIVMRPLTKPMAIYISDLRNNFSRSVKDKSVTRTIIKDFIDSDDDMISLVIEFQSIHHLSKDSVEVMSDPKIFLNWQKLFNSWLLNFENVDKMPELLISSSRDRPPKHKPTLMMDHRESFLLENNDLIGGTLNPIKKLELRVDDPYTIVNVYLLVEPLIEDLICSQNEVEID